LPCPALPCLPRPVSQQLSQLRSQSCTECESWPTEAGGWPSAPFHGWAGLGCPALNFPSLPLPCPVAAI